MMNIHCLPQEIYHFVFIMYMPPFRNRPKWGREVEEAFRKGEGGGKALCQRAQLIRDQGSFSKEEWGILGPYLPHAHMQTLYLPHIISYMQTPHLPHGRPLTPHVISQALPPTLVMRWSGSLRHQLVSLPCPCILSVGHGLEREEATPIADFTNWTGRGKHSVGNTSCKMTNHDINVVFAGAILIKVTSDLPQCRIS